MKHPDGDFAAQLHRLHGWTLDAEQRCIDKSWTFAHFEAAVAFFNAVAALAQAHDHHPEVWSSHTRLRIRLWTHETGGLSDKDFALARAIDQLEAEASAAGRAQEGDWARDNK